MSKKSLSAVKAKSEELKIPYENLLSAFVIEEAVTAVCESDEAENFRLKNNSILSLEYYRRKAPTRLEYVILSEEELTVRNVIHRMSKICLLYTSNPFPMSVYDNIHTDRGHTGSVIKKC